MFKMTKLLAISFSMLVLVACSEETPQITQADYLALQGSSADYILLDVRTKEEFDEGHISNAINVSHDDIEKNLASLLQYKDKKVIVHCRSGRRAEFAENLLTENGFTNVWHLTGDMNGWQAAKLPLVVNKTELSKDSE